jgi:hypothetical protein
MNKLMNVENTNWTGDYVYVHPTITTPYINPLPIPNTYPVYPQQQPNICPGCGRCRQCGQPAPQQVQITCQNNS